MLRPHRWFSWVVLLISLGVMVRGAVAEAKETAAPALYELQLVSVDGSVLDAAEFAGQVVLFVNVASFCGYTPQYAGLQSLYDRYRDRGLVVIGIPSNQFGGQEPGTNDDIKSFCTSRFGVTFPLLAKQEVNGSNRSPLYRFLVQSEAGGGKDIGWNFEKFVVGRDGQVLGRFPAHIVPQDPRLVAAIEMALAGAS